MRKLLSYVRRAVDDYTMIKEGDRVAVGLSGGKDSLALLAGLAGLRRFYPKAFSLTAVTVDMGFEEADFSPLKAFCVKLDVPFVCSKTEIGPIIFDVRKESNPCALCAKMRRGALHDAAKEAGCNVVALGHHRDDALETFFMNLYYEGRIGCFQPVTYLDRKELTVIRPLIYLPEHEIRAFAKRQELPVYKNPCPADGVTTREKMKDMLRELERENHGVKDRVFAALQRSHIDGWKEPGHDRI